MTVRYIRRPEGLGEPLGRYSHVAIGRGELVAIAGQVGIDATGTVVASTLAGQLRQAFANLGTALAAAGLQYGDLLKTTTYLVGSELMDDFMKARTEVFADLFPDENYPPNTLLVVQRLVDPALLVEVEGLALGSSGS